MRTINHWINGRTVDTEPERTGAVYDPATGQQTARVAYATGDDVDAAVRAAQAAYPAWRDTSVVRRARVMFAFRDLLERHRDELARIIASEHGKVVPDAVGEVQRGLEVVEVACGIPHLLKGDFSEKSPLSRCGMPQATSTTSRPRCTSPTASGTTLPCSDAMMRASSSRWRSIRSRKANMTRARLTTEVSRQAG